MSGDLRPSHWPDPVASPRLCRGAPLSIALTVLAVEVYRLVVLALFAAILGEPFGFLRLLVNGGRDSVPARAGGSKGISADPDLAWFRNEGAQQGFGADGRIYLSFLDKKFGDDFVFRINVGGETVPKKEWISDRNWPPVLGQQTGQILSWGQTPQDSTGVVDPAPPDVYKTVRHTVGSPLTYDIRDVPDGTYKIRLHFSTGSASASATTFDVAFESAAPQAPLASFNPVTAAGGANKVVVGEATGVSVGDANPGLQIVFSPVGGTDEAIVAAIEILETAGSGFVKWIDCGGSGGTTFQPVLEHDEWVGDASLVGTPAGMSGSLPDQDQTGVVNPAPKTVYRTRRHSADPANRAPHVFDLADLPNGTYNVRIHFAGATENESFDYEIEGEAIPELQDIDPYALAGGQDNQVVIVDQGPTGAPIQVTVSDGNGMQIESIPDPMSQTGESYEAAIELEFLGEVDDTDIFLLVNDSPLDDIPAASSWVPWNGSDGRLNTDGPGNSQFFHEIAVDQVSGNVALTWEDSQSQQDLRRVQFFWTHTTSLIPSIEFAPESLFLPGEVASFGGNDSEGVNSQSRLGDYTSIDFHFGVVFSAWANNSGQHGNPDPEGPPDPDPEADPGIPVPVGKADLFIHKRTVP